MANEVAVTGVVHGFDDDCPQCRSLHAAAARRWSPLCRCLQWVAAGEVVVLVLGALVPGWKAVLLVVACAGLVALLHCALVDLQRLRARHLVKVAAAGRGRR